ncbi:MOSC domain-containing protein [Pseudomarimonas salicorniae]|uniref:MOSC domain-containing protein n=1 Tax=Pseudomarimonas salicorniae TaxID=2933270 RepID=A0ABT0GEE4_9GAMM|nr:MOSC N-terminal beta barrel domain-containing protein [Lysobacter sp. CAU 1642]MCK7592916.1 MOSC domain-containing protein [Lysobacter sp. CAU 1642]
MHVSRLFIHPIKSCASLAVEHMEVRARGPHADRRWMLVDESGRFVTGRKLAPMVRLRAAPIPAGLQLGWDAETMRIAEPGGEHGRLQVTVWKSEVDAALADPAVSSWISERLGAPLRLVFMDARSERWASPERAGPGQPVSFADGYPYLMFGESALDAMNARIDPPVPAEAFRPNIVVAGNAAHAEDGWQRLRIGSISFRQTKPCVRCVFTTVDPQRGERRPDGEPLKSLRGYRLAEDGVLFGVNLVAESSGIIRLGDPVEVLDQ